ncbi:MAG: dihydrolipoamide acetyltransferase family protein [bacterium]
MAVDVIMPQMGESVAEGTIVRWLKEVGDTVDRDEPIFEITTDKVDAEIPAPEAGVLLEIKVGAGETVEVGTVVARIGAAGEGGGKPDKPAKPAEKPKADATDAQADGDDDGADDGERNQAVDEANQGGDDAAATEGARTGETAPGDDDHDDDRSDKARADMSAQELRRARSTPVVRKIAEEHAIDIRRVDGTGLDGRVTKKDILAYIDDGRAAPKAAAPKAAAPTAPEAPAHKPAAEAQKAPAAPRAAAPAEGKVTLGVPMNPVAIRDRDSTEPMSRMRRTISDRMIQSKQYSAHVHTCFEVDYGKVDALRRKYKARYAERDAKVTFTTFIARAAVKALQAFPVVNAAHDGENIIYRGDINLGIAVAIDNGLIVPVIHGADELSMVGLSKRIADLGDRARTKKLKPDEVAGVTFSITNPGIFGSQWGTPIIPQPTVAILGVGTIEKRVKVITLPDGSDTFGVKLSGYLTLGFDHRIIDGAVADQFMSHVKQTLETFDESAM